MRQIRIFSFLMLAGLVGLASFSFMPAATQAETKAALEVKGAFIKKPVKGAKAAAGVMTIINNTPSANALIAASSDLSEVVELHIMEMDGDIMRMRKVDSIAIPAATENGAGQAELSMETGDHLMFINPLRDVAAGDIVPVALEFENGAKLMVDFEVRDSLEGAGHHDNNHYYGDHPQEPMHGTPQEHKELRGLRDDHAIDESAREVHPEDHHEQDGHGQHGH